MFCRENCGQLVIHELKPRGSFLLRCFLGFALVLVVWGFLGFDFFVCVLHGILFLSVVFLKDLQPRFALSFCASVALIDFQTLRISVHVRVHGHTCAHVVSDR